MTDPCIHGARGDERIRTADRVLSDDSAYEIRTEHVYIVGAFNDDRELLAIKVGVSRNAAARLNTLQVATWYPLELLAEFDALPGAEKRIHSRLAPFWIRGEWFRGTDEAMEIVESFCEACVSVVEDEQEAATVRAALIARAVRGAVS